MAASNTGKKGRTTREKPHIHIFDFKYPTGQNSDSIRSSITNEFVRHFGNPIFAGENESSLPKEQDEKSKLERKQQDDNKVVTSHHLLNGSEFQEEILDISINKRYVCLLLRDGSVHRASCSLNVEKNFPSEEQNVRKKSSQNDKKEEPFQVLSDESFARSLQRSLDDLNDLTGNILSGRRSYSNISGRNLQSIIPPPAIFVNNVPTSYGALQNLPGSPSSSFELQREYSNQLPPRLPSVASMGSYNNRYAPFPNVRRQRRIQMEMGQHLLGVSQVPTQIMNVPHQNNENHESIDIPEGQSVPIGLFENITIVSLENNNESSNEFQINALPPNVSSPSEMDDAMILPLENPIPVLENPIEQQTRLRERPGPSSQITETETTFLPNAPPPYRTVVDNFNNLTEQAEVTQMSMHNKPFDNNLNTKINFDNKNPRSSPLLHNTSRSSKSRKENSWSSQIGDLCESGLMGEKQFMKINAMESCFLLIDEEGHLWTWYNDAAKPTKATYEWNEKDPIIAIGCNMYRATLLLESNCYVTFYDKCFQDVNGEKIPDLVATLSHCPLKFNELINEQILDIQCATFYTTVQTKTGRVFWWGLAPLPERSTNSLLKSRSAENAEITVGDLVSPKQEKNEMGCLVFNIKLHQFGIIKTKCTREEDTQQQSIDRVVVACISRSVFKEAGEELLNSFSTEWDCKDVVFLQEQNASTGTVVSFDGQYVIVKMKNTANDQKGDLKVYLKSSVEKVVNEGNSKLGQTRYQKYLISSPVEVFANPEFTVSAVAANEVGLSFLVNRNNDGKAFLVHPSSLANDYNKWFTCGKNDINRGENIKSDCTSTIEYEATPAEESRLCIKQCIGPNALKENSTLLDHVADGSFFDMSGINEDKFLTATSLSDLDIQLNQPEHTPKFLRSFSMPTGGKTDSQLKRKWKNTLNVRLNDLSSKIKKPSLLSFGLTQNNTCLLLDNANCFYPIQFDCSLSNPPLLEIVPMKSLVLFDRGVHKDEQVLTVLAVPKKSTLITALSTGDKAAIQRTVFQMEKSAGGGECNFDFPYTKRIKLSKEDKSVSLSRRVSINQCLDERCNGNQNIMHVAASNILKTESKVPLLGNIMDIRNNEENAMLQTFLNCAPIWPKIRELLCERDSHGCTPFMTAVIMHNLRGADLILEAIKRDGRNELKISSPVDKNLFQNAICQPAFSGLTPIHALIHCSSKKQSSQQWYSTLKVSNLPPSYSSRLLLKLFKSRYPSAYRAIMPIPEPQWHQRTVRKKLDDEKHEETNEPPSNTTKGKTKMTPTQFQRQISGQRVMYPGTASASMYRPGSSRTFMNRADMLRANAKEGLVMFGDINEMYQALSEMSNHSLLTKADHPSGALLSVVQHLLQVELYQEKHKPSNSPSPNQGGSTSSKPTYIIHPLATDMPFEITNTPPKHVTTGSTTDISPQMREQTINKCFDDIMVHLLMTSLVTADPNILSSVNTEGDTALSYFLNTYPRYSPSHLHKLFLNWRPCNQTNCKYNRHLGKITITSQKEIEPANQKQQQQSAEEKHNNKFSGEEDNNSKKPGTSKRKMPDNPILARRGLQNRTGSLTLNVKARANVNDYVSSPITPSIRVIDNLKFGPIEVQSCSGLTPQIQQPMTALDVPTDRVGSNNNSDGQQQGSSSSRKAPLNLSPFFPVNLPPGAMLDGMHHQRFYQQQHSQTSTVTTLSTSSSNNSSSSSISSSSTSHNPLHPVEMCICHINKARLLWNTTFQASVFYLAKSWPCIVSSVMCAQSKSAAAPASSSSALRFISCNKLDIFTENLLLNPYNVLLEVFVKTLQNKFRESKVSRNAILLPTLHRLNPIDQNHFTGKTFNGLLPWLTMHRFVRSLVRQLSLSLSKNPMPDGNLKLKIGRHANKNHLKRETRLKEHLSLCLRAFSWISVIEILKAATAMLKPIRLGTVKAQPKGIIRDIHNIGQASTSRGAIHSGIRMHIPTGSNLSHQRLNVRYASRRSPVSASTIPANAASMLTTTTRLSNETIPETTTTAAGTSALPSAAAASSSMVPDEENLSDNDESINIEESFHFSEDSEQSFERNETDINEIDWTQAQGITPDSSLAWALDGHIRMRNEVSSRLIPPTGMWQFNQQGQIYQQIMNTPSVHAGYLYLSRMFCRLVKEAMDIAAYLHKTKGKAESEASSGTFIVPPLVFSEDVENALRKEASEQLASTWSWMKEILTTLEEQLSVGDDFDTKHFVLRLKKSAPEGDIAGLGRPAMTHIYGSTPDEYMMYLLKQDMGEASNSLPVLDLFSYTHLTYVLDAFLYMNKLDPFLLNPVRHTKEEINNSSDVSAEPKDIKFFQPAIDLKSPVTENTVKLLRQHVAEKAALASQIFVWLDEAHLKKQKQKKDCEALNTGGEQWNRVMDAFSTLFLSEGPGYERDSFLAIKAGASGRIARFQRTLTSIRGTDTTRRAYTMAQENPALLINVVRSRLLHDCINFFTENMDNHPFGSLRVRFEGEEGTGPGVNRGLFAAFATALKSGQRYKDWPVEFFAECGVLPCQKGIFSPKIGKYHIQEPSNMYFDYPMSQEKRNSAFVAIGRFLGLTLWFNQTIPFILSRPVLLYLLGKEEDVSFDDLAFYDSGLYKTYSDLISDTMSPEYTNEEFMDIYNLCFEVTIDGHVEELIKDGRNVRVTKQNAIKYVRLCAHHQMFVSRENELQGLREGFQQMIPKELLENLEAEDLQLLLSGGVEDISLSRLRSIITFCNSRGCSRQSLERYKDWFWKIVMKMTSTERQKLLYFATGSSVLPALDNRVGNNEELSITVDIINSTNSSALPMSSTCGQRISMPLYPTKAILKTKLMQAIECQTYGLG